MSDPEVLAERDGLRVVLSIDIDPESPADWANPTDAEWETYAEGGVYGWTIQVETLWLNVATSAPRTTWEPLDDCWGLHGYNYAVQSALEAFADELAFRARKVAS